MSRALRLIAQYFMYVWDEKTTIDSIRISNEIEHQPLACRTKVSVRFKEETFDQNFYKSLLSLGLFLDDICELHTVSGETQRLAEVTPDVLSSKTSGIDLLFFKELKPISTKQIISTLKAETFYGLPASLYQHQDAHQVKVFFGAGLKPLDLKIRYEGQSRMYDGQSFILKNNQSGSISLTYLDEVGQLKVKSGRLFNYLDSSTKNQIFRHAFTPKSGMSIYTTKIRSELVGDNFLTGWPLLKELLQKGVKDELSAHTAVQVKRITHRLQRVNHREWLIAGNKKVFLVPQNEVETVLLFQKIAHQFPQLLPQGMRIDILDYSPKDIDSICKFQLSPHHPEEIIPVEFEFRLESFFKHGHDHRQVKLIICFTVNPLTFPFEHGGVNYNLNRTTPIPRLENNFDHSSIPCLILDELFR
jgi:hypothetical protein